MGMRSFVETEVSRIKIMLEVQISGTLATSKRVGCTSRVGAPD